MHNNPMLSRFVALPKQIFRAQCYLPGLMLTVGSAVAGEIIRLSVGKLHQPSCRRLGGDMGYPFLSTEWIPPVMAVRDEYVNQLPDVPVPPLRVNLQVTGVPAE